VPSASSSGPAESLEHVGEIRAEVAGDILGGGLATTPSTVTVMVTGPCSHHIMAVESGVISIVSPSWGRSLKKAW
jgi:hypothetical protein